MNCSVVKCKEIKNIYTVKRYSLKIYLKFETLNNKLSKDTLIDLSEVVRNMWYRSWELIIYALTVSKKI